MLPARPCAPWSRLRLRLCLCLLFFCCLECNHKLLASWHTTRQSHRAACVCVWLTHKCISRNIDGSTCGTDAGKVWGGGGLPQYVMRHMYCTRAQQGGGRKGREGEGCSACRRIRLQFVLISIKFAVLICALLPCTRSCYVYASLRFDWLPVGSAID